MFLFLQNYINFSSNCVSPCHIAIAYIVMNKWEIYVFRHFLSRCEALYTIPMFFDILFLTSSLCLFQEMFSSNITLRNLIKYYRFILILLKVIAGNLNGILSRALCLFKKWYLVFSYFCVKRTFVCYKPLINIV